MKTSTAFPSAYLKAADLPRPVKVTIKHVTLDKVGDGDKPILHFVGKDKGLVLNKTNAHRIEDATGSDEMDDWAGWSVTLYSCKVDYQGQRVDAIRVDDRPGATTKPAGKAKAKAAEPDPDEPVEDVPFTDDDIQF